jgi:hypothetical protein
VGLAGSGLRVHALVEPTDSLLSSIRYNRNV